MSIQISYVAEAMYNLQKLEEESLQDTKDYSYGSFYNFIHCLLWKKPLVK